MAELATEPRIGPGRVLLLTYALFVVAAGARSTVQLVLHAARAPLAYALSAVAAVVYLAGFVLVRAVERDRLGSGPAGSRGVVRAARVCSLVELSGVLVVGTLSIVRPSAFADKSVWSDYGAGYLGVPLLLPIAVLCWLRLSVQDRPARAVSCRSPASGRGCGPRLRG